MFRLLVSVLVGLGLGVGVGLFLGWNAFPVQFVNSPASSLAESYKDDYIVRVAAGYLEDADLGGAVERLRILGVPNVPAYVQDVTERYITTSRDATAIGYLVALAEGLGRLTPIMEPYRQVRQP